MAANGGGDGDARALAALLAALGLADDALDEPQQQYLEGLLTDYEAAAARWKPHDLEDAQAEFWDALHGQVPDLSDEAAPSVYAWFERRVCGQPAAAAAAAGTGKAPGALGSPFAAAVDALANLYTECDRADLETVLSAHGGDVNEAIKELGRLMSEAENQGNSSTRPGGLDDDLKRRIIETYYVREVKLVNGEEASARPVLRLTEEKRNIRFRDNKVVSTKGERLIIEKNEEEEAALKKTYVSIRPLRKYRFH